MDLYRDLARIGCTAQFLASCVAPADRDNPCLVCTDSSSQIFPIRLLPIVLNGLAGLRAEHHLASDRRS